MKSGEVKQRGRKVEEPIPTIVVYGYEKSKKKYLSVIEGVTMDDILTIKRKPIIPNEFTIFDVGVGKSFIIRYMKQYNITEIAK